MKYWLLGLLLLAGCAPLFAVQAPSGWKTAQFDYYYYDTEDGTSAVPDYKLGPETVHASGLSYSCSEQGTSLSIPVRPGNNCYSAFLSSDAFSAKQDLHSGETQTISQYLKVVPEYSGSWNTERSDKKDWKQTWNFQFSPDSIKAFPVSQDFNVILGQGKILVDIENNLPSQMEGGVNVIITDTKFFKQEDKDYPLTLLKGRNRYELPINFDVLGVMEIDLQPYIKTYDTSTYTTENTGICFKPEGQAKKCYSKKLIAFDQHLLYKYGTFPTGTDLNKDVTTDCKTNNDCPTTFSCQNNICTRIKGQTQETILQEAFIKQPRSDILPVITAIALIMLTIFVVVKSRGR